MTIPLAEGMLSAMRRLIALHALTALLSACGGSADAGGGMEVVRETVGDTTVVRTISGSVWETPRRMVPEVSIGALDGDAEYLFGRIGSIGVGPDGTVYVLDRQAPDLRAYDADGGYLTTMGEQGEGPGELSSPGALAVLSDGRVLVRDPGNARIEPMAVTRDDLDVQRVVRYRLEAGAG